MKEKSKKILKRINDEEEEVITTVSYLSEVNNLLKKAMNVNDLQSLLLEIHSLENIKIIDVCVEDYLSANNHNI